MSFYKKTPFLEIIETPVQTLLMIQMKLMKRPMEMRSRMTRLLMTQVRLKVLLNSLVILVRWRINVLNAGKGLRVLQT